MLGSARLHNNADNKLKPTVTNPSFNPFSYAKSMQHRMPSHKVRKNKPKDKKGQTKENMLNDKVDKQKMKNAIIMHQNFSLLPSKMK